MDEAFGVKGPGGLQGTSALSQHIRCSVMMDIIGGEHRDPGMAVLGVVPGEERPAEGDGGGNVFEAAREGDPIKWKGRRAQRTMAIGTGGISTYP